MVLTIVTVMSFLAASMTAMFMMNVNLTQSSFNGDIALTEAETALSELMYNLGDDNTHSFGKADEEIRGQATPGFRKDEAYHVLTFKSGTGFPRSTNNIGGSGPASGDGRQVPVDCVHVYSTGVCRGQRRTIEAVIRKPPAPYGLCASGSIHSVSPLTVLGVSKASSNVNPLKPDRPGHVVSNGEIKVDAPGSNITGFMKACGPVTVVGPAQVAGGLRPNASNTVLLDIDIPALNPQSPSAAASPNEGGMTGVVEIIETNHGAQKMDVMYYCGHNLKFEGPVQMDNAFLYVKGNLEILGGLWGTGAIVVDGDVTITGGTSLAAANDSEVALLASGMITLRQGANNYFRGILYSKKGLDAKNMVVIGSAIVNSNDATQGRCELDQMTFVADDAMGKIDFTSKSYDDAKVQVSDGLKSPYQSLLFFGVAEDATKGTTPWSPDLAKDGLQKSVDKIVWQMMGTNTGVDPSNLASNPGDFATAFAKMGTPGNSLPLGPRDNSNPWQTRAYDLLDDLQDVADEAVQAAADLASAEGAMSPIPTTAQQQAVDTARQKVDLANQKLIAAVAKYQNDVTEMAKDFLDWAQERSNADGSYRSRGERPTNVERNFIFDLNRYLPYSDRLQVTYWQVLPSRK